jgi:hypothetical protein
MSHNSSLEKATDDTLLGMLRRANAAHFIKAAKLAHEKRQGYTYLLDRGLYGRFRSAFGFIDDEYLTQEQRGMAFCFMAAMIEAGDA